MKKVILVVGRPATFKSTIARAFAAQGATVIDLGKRDPHIRDFEALLVEVNERLKAHDVVVVDGGSTPRKKGRGAISLCGITDGAITNERLRAKLPGAEFSLCTALERRDLNNFIVAEGCALEGVKLTKPPKNYREFLR